MRNLYLLLIAAFIITHAPSCGTAQPPCMDGVQNNGETGIDCGGPQCLACPPSCTDGIRNQNETGIDCGGACAPCAATCTDGIQNQGETGIDCGGPCTPCAPSCTDGIKNQGETGVDCGGPCSPCAAGCSDGIQNNGETGIDCGGTCMPCAPTCTDGIQNQGETGIDCGGPCSACIIHCASPNDCPNGYNCVGGICVPPTCTDGVQNQGELGIDCGGPNCNPCPGTCTDGLQNQGETGIDCGGPCTPCPTCSDGIQNQGETGVDCGGPCGVCVIHCVSPNDCPVGYSCVAGTCVPATCSDGIQNQGETGIDCGGPCTPCAICPSTTTDADGNVYNVVTVGTQCWTKENLATTHYTSGTGIPEIEDPTTWGNIYNNATQLPAWCYFQGDVANNAIYGKLYNWYAASSTDNVCPTGWHVPTDVDFTQLVNYLGGDSVAGGKMKSLLLWNTPNVGADNSSNLTMLPGGGRHQLGTHYGTGTNACFWSYTSYSSTDGLAMYLSDANTWSMRDPGTKERAFSIRCIKD